MRSDSVNVLATMPRTVAKTLLLAGVASGALAALPAPSTAHAATVGAPKVLRAGQDFPIDFIGGFRRGRPIPRGFEVVSRDVALGPRETTRVRMRCRATAPRIRTLGFPDASPLGFQLVAPRRYGGRRQVTIRVYLAPDVRDTGARGTAYVLCRRGGR
jgi:hypothetical protein